MNVVLISKASEICYQKKIRQKAEKWKKYTFRYPLLDIKGYEKRTSKKYYLV